MRSRLMVLVCLATVLAATASGFVNMTSRSALSQGATFDVFGSGFTRPVRAWLSKDGTRIPLAVARGATDVQFTAKLPSFPKGFHGDCLLAVRTKGSKVPSYFAGMSIELPSIAGVGSATASAGDEVTLTGSSFGARRSRVSVGGVRAKITSWTDTGISFLVPPAAQPGLRLVVVENRAGSSQEPATITVQ